MNFRRLAGTALLSAAAITFGTAGTSHAQVNIQAGGCELRITNVLALDLQETPADEIFMIVGDERTRTVSFTEGQTREGSDFGTPDQVTEFIPPRGVKVVSLWEDDFRTADRIGAFKVLCKPTATQVDLFDPAGLAFYRVSYVVTQLP